MGMRSDFVLKSKGHCFFCLDQISSQLFPDGNSDNGNEYAALPNCSVQRLSRYLGMEFMKRSHQMTNDLVSPHLFDIIKYSKSERELCESCMLLNDNFGMLYHKLEKIQMEVGASLNQIFLRLLKSAEKNSLKLTTAPGWDVKVDVLKGWRTAAIEKCSRILGAADPPRVKVQNLSNGQIKKAAEKFIHKSHVPMDEGSSYNPNFDQFSDSSMRDLDRTTNDNDKYRPDTSEPITPEAKIPRSKLIPETGKYQCPICESDFTLVSNFNKHYKAIHLNVKVNCEICKKEFKYRSGYRSHLIIAHKISQTGIPIPEGRLNSKTGKYKCTICAGEFTRVSGYKEHYRVVHQKVKFNCKTCGDEFKSRNAYRAHRLIVHMGITFTCQVCSRCFTRKSALKRHQRVTSCRFGRAPKPKTLTCYCEVCGKGFTRKHHLKLHLEEVHLNPRKHVCDICGICFSRKCALIFHQGSVHSVKPAPSQSKAQNLPKGDMKKANKKGKQIGKKTSDSGSLSIEFSPSAESEPVLEKVIVVKLESVEPLEPAVTVCSDPDNFYCPNGESITSTAVVFPPDVGRISTNQKKKTKSITNLQTKQDKSAIKVSPSPVLIPNVELPQSRLNTQTQKYKCNVCTREFKTVQHYKEHYTAIHMNLTYKCNDCGKEFKSRRGYQTHHLATHMGVRFNCQVCGKCFTRKHHLQNHVRVTSCRLGKAPQPNEKHICHCEICGTGFSRKDRLQRHIKVVHLNSLKHVCRFCGREFKQKCSMLRHQSRAICQQKLN